MRNVSLNLTVIFLVSMPSLAGCADRPMFPWTKVIPRIEWMRHSVEGTSPVKSLKMSVSAIDSRGTTMQYIWGATRGTLESRIGSEIVWRPIGSDGHPLAEGPALLYVVAHNGQLAIQGNIDIAVDANGDFSLAYDREGYRAYLVPLNRSLAEAAKPAVEPVTAVAVEAGQTNPSQTVGTAAGEWETTINAHYATLKLNLNLAPAAAECSLKAEGSGSYAPDSKAKPAKADARMAIEGTGSVATGDVQLALTITADWLAGTLMGGPAGKAEYTFAGALSDGGQVLGGVLVSKNIWNSGERDYIVWRRPTKSATAP